MLPRPLTSRKADLAYFSFFVVRTSKTISYKKYVLTERIQSHVFASLLMDFQTLYPPSLVPAAIAKLPKMYIEMSGDPLIGSALGLPGFASPMVWFHSFLLRELLL